MRYGRDDSGQVNATGKLHSQVTSAIDNFGYLSTLSCHIRYSGPVTTLTAVVGLGLSYSFSATRQQLDRIFMTQFELPSGHLLLSIVHSQFACRYPLGYTVAAQLAHDPTNSSSSQMPR
jgi:hypothetical protein